MPSIPDLELADWRRRVAALYAAVRDDDDPERGHALWRATRDELFQTHPQSPLPPSDPLWSGLPYWPYDASLRDGTAGETSYGGGRYALDTAKGADLGGAAGTLIVDLNFLYHPSCRYNDRWRCPLAPAANVIAAPVRAGERL